MNLALIAGRVKGEPKFFGGGKTAKLSFTVITKTAWDGGQREDYHNVVIWGSAAEAAQNKVSDNTAILVRGAVRSRKYTASDGVEKRITEIVVSGNDSIEILDEASVESGGIPV